MSDSPVPSPPPDDTESPLARLRRRAVLLPLVLVALAYANTLGSGFVWDDVALIEEQSVVRERAPPQDYFTRMFWSDPMAVSRGYYRPLVTLDYALEYQLWNGAPEGFHLTSLVLHLLVVACVYLTCRRAGASEVGAAVGASVFGLFPRLTESVAWVAGRTDLMAAGFSLAALLLYRQDSAARRWGAALLVLLGLFCKEVAVVAVVGFAVLEFSAVRARERTLSQAVRHLVPMAVALAAYAAFRLYALRSDVRELTGGADVELTSFERVLTALAAVGHYAAMLVDALRPRLQIGKLGEYPAGWVLAGVAVLVAAGVALRRWGGRLSAFQQAALAMGACALGMVLHLVPLEMPTLAADRFLYIPVAMLVVAAVVPLERVARRSQPRNALALTALVLVAFTAATALRNRDWVDEFHLWSAAERRSGPGDTFVQLQLNKLYIEAHRYEEALVHLQRVVKGDRRVTGIKAYNNLALCLTKLGRHAEASALYEEMVRQQPSYRRAYLNLAMTYARAGRFDDARRELERLKVRAPNDPTVPRLRELFDRTQATLSSLPPVSDTESAAVAETRAHVFEDLGAPSEAARAWERVLDAPGATPEQHLRAAGFLAFEGGLAQARQALERLRREQPEDARLPALEETLLARTRLTALR